MTTNIKDVFSTSIFLPLAGQYHRKSMQCPVFLVILAVAVVTHSHRNSPKGLQFLGVGYNLLKGNPEGAEISKGGVDPGLFVTRKIFQLPGVQTNCLLTTRTGYLTRSVLHLERPA